MLYCIVKLPNKYKLGDIIHGADMLNTDIEFKACISGRDIVVSPLIFYKTFSEFKNCVYEHVFATDVELDCLYLKHNIYNNTIIKDIAALIPISVKRIDKTNINDSYTFLFVKQIEYLLLHYTKNKSITDWDSDLSKDMHVSELVANPFNLEGITGNLAFILKVFDKVRYYYNEADCPFLQDMNVINNADKLALEIPYEAASEQDDFKNYTIMDSSDEFFEFIDDTMMPYDKSHAHPLNYFTKQCYPYELDPITTMCIRTPSYITTYELRTFLSDKNMEYSYFYKNIADENIKYTNTLNYIPFQWTAFNYNLCTNVNDLYFNDYINELINYIIHIPFNNVVLYSNKNNIKCELTNVPIFEICNEYEPAYIKHVASNFMTYFTKRVTCYLQDNNFVGVTIIKTWLDELYVSFNYENKSPLIYYINLNWFHLTSKSLVNMSVYNYDPLRVY